MAPTIRLANLNDARGIARVKVDGWREAYAHILPASTLENLDVEEQARRFAKFIQDGGRYWIAEQDGEVLGFSVFGDLRDPKPGVTAELHAIYIHPSAQRRGLGVRLLRAGLDELIEAGHRSMAVFCFAENRSARAFYAKWGARFADHATFTVEGIEYPDVGMAWDDLEETRARIDANQPFEPIQIRTAGRADIPTLARLRIECWQATYRGIMDADYLAGMSLDVELPRWEAGFDKGEEAFLVELRGVPVGYLAIGPAYELPDVDLSAYGEIRSLYLLPEAQGFGLGKSLMAIGAQRLIERGYRKLIVWSFAENTRAVSFYQSLGSAIMREQTYEIGGRHHPDVQMGWESIDAFFEQVRTALRPVRVIAARQSPTEPPVKGSA